MRKIQDTAAKSTRFLVQRRPKILVADRVNAHLMADRVNAHLMADRVNAHLMADRVNAHLKMSQLSQCSSTHSQQILHSPW